MRGQIELLLEDADGTVVGQRPAWRAEERQFLWEVVHDTRGILRRTVAAEDVAVIRNVDAAGAAPDKAVAAQRALDAYTRAAEALRAQAEQGPQFHWVSRQGSDDWAAVCHIETDDGVVTVVGGWNRPVVRHGHGPDAPTETMAAGQEAVEVADTVVRVRRQSFYDLFADDLDRLIRVLADAAERGLRARFVQR